MSERVLLVHPDADRRARYRQSLQEALLDVEEAADGRDALVAAIMRPPTVIVTAVQLPIIDAAELCRLLRHDCATERSGIIVVAPDVQPSQIGRIRAAGADVVLAEACPPEALVAHVVQLAESLAGDGARPQPSPPTAAAPSGRFKARTHQRFETTAPASAPPELRCPACDGPLRYEKSYIGGVNACQAEQWDSFTCEGSCGAFEYRQRTRKIYRVKN